MSPRRGGKYGRRCRQGGPVSLLPLSGNTCLCSEEKAMPHRLREHSTKMKLRLRRRCLDNSSANADAAARYRSWCCWKRIYIPAGGPIAGFGVTAQSDFFEVAEDVLLPQFVVGGGYRSEVVVSNPASRPVDVVLSVFDISGAPLVTQIDGASRSSLSFTVPPLASRTVSAPETSGVVRPIRF